MAAATLVATLASIAQPVAAAKKPAPTTVEGLFVKVDGDSIVVAEIDEKHFTETIVPTDAKTTFMIDGSPAKPADLKPGERVIITPPSGKATQVEVKAPKVVKIAEAGLVEGQFVKVEKETLFVRTIRGAEVVDAKAVVVAGMVVTIDGKPGKLEDLKQGEALVLVNFDGHIKRLSARTAEAVAK